MQWRGLYIFDLGEFLFNVILNLYHRNKKSKKERKNEGEIKGKEQMKRKRKKMKSETEIESKKERKISKMKARKNIECEKKERKENHV